MSRLRWVAGRGAYDRAKAACEPGDKIWRFQGMAGFAQLITNGTSALPLFVLAKRRPTAGESFLHANENIADFWTEHDCGNAVMKRSDDVTPKKKEIPKSENETERTMHKCDSCQKELKDSEVHPITGRLGDFLTRIDPGAEVPSGQCPECGCLTYVHDTRPHKLLDRMGTDVIGIENMLDLLPDVDGTDEIRQCIQDLQEAIVFLETKEDEYFNVKKE